MFTFIAIYFSSSLIGPIHCQCWYFAYQGYIRKSDLRVHMRFHNREKAFKCSYCHKGFYQSGKGFLQILFKAVSQPLLYVFIL